MADQIENEPNWNTESAKAVFRNDYLRAIILGYAVFSAPQNETKPKTLISLRQVQKCWLTTITKEICQKKKPLYSVKLDKNNSVNGTPYVQEKGKCLDLFTTFFTGRDETFKLKLCEEFFRLENYDSLSNAMEHCSNGLVELELQIPEKGGSFPGIFPNSEYGLPNLQKLSLTLTETELNNLEQTENALCNNSSNITILLNSILLQSPNLKHLQILISPDDRDFVSCPPGFQYLPLPLNLQTLKLKCSLSPEDFQILTRNKLPVLTELYVQVCKSPVQPDQIFNILNKCKDTLREFVLECAKITPEPIVNVLKFPKLKNLELLAFVCIIAELDGETKPNLHTHFPKLKHFETLRQTCSSLESWVPTNAKLNSVNRLAVSVYDRLEVEGTAVKTLPSPSLLQNIFLGMPNVTRVKLFLNANSLDDLALIFEKMTHVTFLKLSLYLNGKQIENSDTWDSLLTGIPVDTVKSLRLNPGLEETFNMEIRDPHAVPSIRLLEKLNTLVLDYQEESGNKPAIMSRFAFKFGFMKMLSLKRLTLSGRFRVAQDIVDEWKKEENRNITQIGVIPLPP